MSKLLLILILLLPIIHYDDQDGHREPWAEWKDVSCVSEPVIIMDSSYSVPPCNPNTNKGVTVWMCNDGNEETYHWSYYTTHWYCGTIGAATSRSQVLPIIMAPG